MPEATVLNAGHEVKHSPPDAKRSWTLTRMKDGDGKAYSTFDQAQGQTIIATMGKLVDIEFEQGERGNDLKSIVEHVEYGRAADPVVRDIRLDILDCLKIAEATVNAAAAPDVSVAERWKRIKILAAEISVWLDRAVVSVTDPPFEDDGIPFGDDEPAVSPKGWI